MVLSRLQQLEQSGQKGITYYLLANYPSHEACLRTIDELVAHGMAALELGLPAVDPFMDGEIIAGAHAQVMRNGYTDDDLIPLLAKVRARHPQLPIVLMGYDESFNQPFLRQHTALFDAILCPERPLSMEGTAHIPFVTAADDWQTVRQPSGFVYIGSSKEGTGKGIGSGFASTLQALRRVTDLPLYVGFGIKNAQHIQRVLQTGADGVVIGTELIKRVTEDTASRISWLRENARALKGL